MEEIELDGIVYAACDYPYGEVTKVVNVVPLEGYKLLLTFKHEPERRRVFDVGDLLESSVFQPLRDERLFYRAHIDGETVAWNDQIDIDADTLYEKSVLYAED